MLNKIRSIYFDRDHKKRAASSQQFSASHLKVFNSKLNKILVVLSLCLLQIACVSSSSQSNLTFEKRCSNNSNSINFTEEEIAGYRNRPSVVPKVYQLFFSADRTVAKITGLNLNCWLNVVATTGTLFQDPSNRFPGHPADSDIPSRRLATDRLEDRQKFCVERYSEFIEYQLVVRDWNMADLQSLSNKAAAADLAICYRLVEADSLTILLESEGEKYVVDLVSGEYYWGEIQ